MSVTKDFQIGDLCFYYIVGDIRYGVVIDVTTTRIKIYSINRERAFDFVKSSIHKVVSNG